MAEEHEINEGTSTIRAELEEKQLAAQKNLETEKSASKKPLKRMGWGKFLLGLVLIIIQAVVDWLGVGIIGFLVGGPISLILWFMIRPYKKSLGSSYWFLNGSLIADAIPFIDLVPIDLLFWPMAFYVSRRAIEV